MVTRVDSMAYSYINKFVFCVQTVLQKTIDVSKKIFKAIYDITTFPCRFLGSKTWSIPGLVLRAPVIIFNKIFGLSTDKTLKEEFLRAGYHFNFEAKLTEEQAKEHLKFASVAAFAHGSDLKWIAPFGYKVISPKNLCVQQEGIELRERAFFNPKSGLKILLVEKEGTVVVSFGTITSSKSEMLNQEKLQKKIDKNLHLQVVKNMAGLRPEIFQEADAFFKKLIETPYLKDKNIVLTGQCLGGSLAQFVSIKHQKKSYCYNTFPLGVGLQTQLNQKSLEKACDYVTHVSAKGDFVSDAGHIFKLDIFLSRLGLKTPGNFGHRYFIPSAYTQRKEVHDYCLGSLMQHAGFNNRTVPSELPSELLNF